MQFIIFRLLDIFNYINWLEVIKIVPSIITAAIAAVALKNWKRQDKAKREAEFLDAILEAAFKFMEEISVPVTLFEITKIGIESHKPSWENISDEAALVKGVTDYVRKYGTQETERYKKVFQDLSVSKAKLNSLLAKGQIFGFKNYDQLHSHVSYLTLHSSKLQSIMTITGSPALNYNNESVLKLINNIISMEASEIRKEIENLNAKIIGFIATTYGDLYH